MSFCTKCGKENAGVNAFCTYCGEKLVVKTQVRVPARPVSRPAETAVKRETEPARKKSSKKARKQALGFVVLICSLLLLTAIGAVVLILVRNNQPESPEKIIKSVVADVNNKEYSESVYWSLYMNNLASDVSSALLNQQIENGDSDFDSSEELCQAALYEIYDSLEDKFGPDWSVNYTIKEVSAIKKSSDEFDDIKGLWEAFQDEIKAEEDYYNEMSEMYDAKYADSYAKVLKEYSKKYKKYKLTEVQKVKLKITVEGKYDKDSDTEELFFGKVNDTWILLDGEFLGNLY